MGRAAAYLAASILRDRLKAARRVGVMLAAAPSQDEFLAAFRQAQGIDWPRVEAFHMDEYVGLSADAPQSFRRFLDARFFSQLNLGAAHLIEGDAPDPDAACARYAAALQALPPALICAGIGENGHLAFNDPPVADFDDPALVKPVTLDHACRVQQVNDGCFPTIGDVPERALTVTIPAFMGVPHVVLCVPGAAKAAAVAATLNGAVETSCPASVLRGHGDAHLFLDPDSAAHLGEYRN
nr:6-phosphogluconolactonase [Oceaniglobus trochenteri]